MCEKLAALVYSELHPLLPIYERYIVAQYVVINDKTRMFCSYVYVLFWRQYCYCISASFCFTETELKVVQAVLGFTTDLLPQPPKYWNLQVYHPALIPQ